IRGFGRVLGVAWDLVRRLRDGGRCRPVGLALSLGQLVGRGLGTVSAGALGTVRLVDRLGSAIARRLRAGLGRAVRLRSDGPALDLLARKDRRLVLRRTRSLLGLQLGGGCGVEAALAHARGAADTTAEVVEL